MLERAKKGFAKIRQNWQRENKNIRLNNMDKLLTIKEVAKILRVSERSINRYIESGRLRASRIGQWRIKESDLERFLDKNSNKAKK